MGSMSRAIKEQQIIGLDPRTSLISPVDLVPPVAGYFKMVKGAQMIKAGAKVRQAENLSLFTHIFRYDKVREQVLLGRKMKLKGLLHYTQGIGLVGIGASVLMHKNSIRSNTNQSRGLDTSLTSVSKRPGIGTTQRAKRTKRTLSPRLSKGDNVNRSSRRKTTYCKLHGKYDFCEYYKK